MSHVRKLSLTWSDRSACWHRSVCVENQRTDVTLSSLRSLTSTNPQTDLNRTRADTLCVYSHPLVVTEITIKLKIHMHYLSSLCVKW